MVLLGGSKGRAVLPLLGRPPRIPDPGQHVDIRLEDGSWRRGFRAISEPSTAETADAAISRAYGGRGAAVHSPSAASTLGRWPVSR